jgi:hypothetical protein
MKRVWAAAFIAVCLVSILGITGCGGGGSPTTPAAPAATPAPTPAPTPTPPSFTGKWVGTSTGFHGQQGPPISFTVESNAVTALAIGIHESSGGCDVSGTVTFDPSLRIPITGNTFSFSSGQNTVTGTFSSSTNAAGQFSVSFNAPRPCPTSSSDTWNATKQ